MLKVCRYPASNPLLRSIIKYFWVIESESIASINHKLLPVNNVDLIFNLSSPIEYITDAQTSANSTRFHFNGPREKCLIIRQTGKLRVFGASFFPTGLFPMLNTPLKEFTGRTVGIDEITGNFADEILDTISEVPTNAEVIKKIEEYIAELIDFSLIPDRDVSELIRIFISEDSCIYDFCEEYGINQRRLERIFNKYIGVSPKLFQRINRLHRIINQLRSEDFDTLALCAYEHNYTDQTHFIKDFKTFTGTTPTEFMNQPGSVKQIIPPF